MTEGQPAIAGDSVKPGVERSGTPGDLHEHDSKPAKRAAASSMRSRCRIRYRPLRGLCKIFELIDSWGSASLHPRLYAIARYRGLGFRISTNARRLERVFSFAMKMQPLLQAAANMFSALIAHIK